MFICKSFTYKVVIVKTSAPPIGILLGKIWGKNNEAPGHKELRMDDIFYKSNLTKSEQAIFNNQGIR